MELKLIDSHCHIFDREFNSDRINVLNEAAESGCVAVVSCSQGEEEILKALREVDDVNNRVNLKVYLSFGFDPKLLSKSAFKQTKKIIKENAHNIVAIGEVGLDYFYIKDHKERKLQEEFFREFIRLAKEVNKPVVVHSRSAGKYAINILMEEECNRVLMHAFDGSYKSAMLGVKNGFYFSIPTSVVYSQQKRKLVKKLPLENIMLETDSPVLSPVRGERNTPKNLIIALEEISKIKEIPVSRVGEVTLENTLKFYKIKL